MKKIIPLLILALLQISCNKDDDNDGGDVEIGSIFATVRVNSQIIADAQVSTEPITQTVNTDITGSAILSDIPVGGYKVNAFHPDIGSGSASVTVTANAIMDVTINLIPGVFLNPIVNISSPIDGSVHNSGDNIAFSATVSDAEDEASTLDIEWNSSIDGNINSTAANSDGTISFSTNSLSMGVHSISIKATDSDGLSSTDQITIEIKDLPDAVVLNPVELEPDALRLSWSTSTESNFSNYRILRSENSSGPFNVINVLSNINEVSYDDTNVLFGTRYYYQISVVLDNGDEAFSNIESEVFEGDKIDVGVAIVRMILDPVRPYIYALDQINNSLLFINKDTKAVEKTIFVGDSPQDIDINIQNNRAYIANYGSTQIAVINLDTQEKVDDLFVDTQVGTWDGNPYRLSCLADNKLVYTSEDQWNSIKLINATTGSTFDSYGSIYQPGLLTNSSGTVLFVTESGSSGSATIRYNLSGNTLSQVDESNGGSSWGLRDGCISGNDTYIFHRRTKYLVNNLSSELGTFSENILACNHDGSIAIGEENVWNAETFSIIKPLPLVASLILLDNDDNTIFIYDNNSSSIYISTIN